MITVTLDIRAKDILETEYVNTDDCAITRALHRAGYDNLHDAGIEIEDVNEEPIKIDNNQYIILREKVQHMYHRVHEPADFTFELEMDVEPIDHDLTHKQMLQSYDNMTI